MDDVDVLVIGAGPAGMMAAGRAAELGACVLLIERNAGPGRKLLLTGNGRCNLANARDDLVRQCGRAGSFLADACARFGTRATIEFFDRIGVSVTREADHRLFPSSGRATDVLAALSRWVHRAGVASRFGTRVTGVRPDGPRLAVMTSAGVVRARAVVVATGGLSFPQTGSTGDGHEFAKAMGHEVTPRVPGEVPLRAGPAWVRSLPGVSLRGVVLSAAGKRVEGDIVFTHRGLSGPAALDLSRLAARAIAAGPVEATLDLAPRLSADDVAARVAAEARRHPRRSARRNLCAALEGLPERLAALVPDLAAVKALRFQIQGTEGFAKAVVTVGGVDLREVDPATMESRLVKGLHFAGEVLDLDGPRGGYNLQIAWTTGWVAGTHAGSGQRRG